MFSLQFPEYEGVVNEDLPNSWECPRCCQQGKNVEYKVLSLPNPSHYIILIALGFIAYFALICSLDISEQGKSLQIFAGCHSAVKPVQCLISKRKSER